MLRNVLLLLPLLSLGCSQIEGELPGLFASQSALALSTIEPSAPVAERLGPIARQIADRLTPPALSPPDSLADCAQAPVMSRPSVGTETLVLANLDVRRQTKNLIPRRVTERLETGERPLLASVVDAPVQEPSSRRGQDSPLSASSLTRDDLRLIEQQRYLGVFYVHQYQGPALILRVGKIRREWLEGSLSARFVLFDTQTRSPLCGIELRAKNDVKEAPIRSRLQAETRSRLERALGDALRQEAQRATQRFAPELTWPESGKVVN